MLDYPGVTNMPKVYKTKTGPKAKGEDQTHASRYRGPLWARLYPIDIERIDQLVLAGYGGEPSGPRSEGIRRSIAETAKLTLRK
jgi:hypothetical protein